jgi:glycine/D-amino acid oxidase-like deaminating enzyme
MVLWSDPDSPSAPQLEGTVSADVAIVGGGFAGLSCARHLKEADPSLDIALVERDQVGSGASGRNAGIISPFLPITWLIDCSASLQRLDDIRFASRYIAGETRSLIQLIQGEAIACDLRASKIITTGAGGLYQRQLALIGERCLLAGVPGHIATPAELRATIPYPAHGGYVLDGYAIQPLALVQGLRRYIQRLGIRLYENTRVTGLRPAHTGVDVLTHAGACVKAGKVIVATNAYTHQLGLNQRVPKPVITYMLATAPLDRARLEQLGLENQTIVDIGGEYFYARLYQNRLLFGGFDRPDSTAEALSDRDEPYHRRLRTKMIRRFPLLSDAAIEAAWGGPYHETRTHVPIIRALGNMPDVILNIGYGGVGVSLTQFSGRIVAGLILGTAHRDPDSERMHAIYASTRFPVKEGIKLGWRLLRSLI